VTVTLLADVPRVEVGQHPLRGNLAGQTIPIYVRGGQPVSGLDLFVMVGDGGPALTTLGLPAGTPGPTITKVDLVTGTIFQNGPDLPRDLGTLPQLANWSIALTAGGNVLADGLLATITVDTTGFFEGTWQLGLAELLPNHPFGPLNSSFADERTHVINGTIHVVPAEIVGRHIFYNSSAWDGGDPGGNAADDLAIATDKSALKPGQTATFANYTSYSRGINGIMVDVLGLSNPAALTLDDFQFRVGRSNDLSRWSVAPLPEMSIRLGAGVDGSDRITFVWPSNQIEQEWLEVTVKSNARTLLPRDDVFYFGNAIGEVGNAAANSLVSAFDVIATRDHQRGPFQLAGVTDVYDFNRDRLVSSIDVILARDFQVGLLTALPLITPAQAVQLPARPAARPGDSNRDGIFNHLDFAEPLRRQEFEDQIAGNSDWSGGDWNGDGDFDSQDLVLAFQLGSYQPSSSNQSDLAAAVDWLLAQAKQGRDAEAGTDERTVGAVIAQ
jgi:hypothetical protein